MLLLPSCVAVAPVKLLVLGLLISSACPLHRLDPCTIDFSLNMDGQDENLECMQQGWASGCLTCNDAAIVDERFRSNGCHAFFSLVNSSFGEA